MQLYEGRKAATADSMRAVTCFHPTCDWRDELVLAQQALVF